MKGETADDGDALRLTLPLPQEGAFVPVVRIRGRGIV
jgi:alpha-L-fucosidase